MSARTVSWDGIAQSESERFVANVPAPLRQWADSLIGQFRGKRAIAGWGWDGRSPGVEILLAPKGRAYIDAPADVWGAACSVRGEAPA